MDTSLQLQAVQKDHEQQARGKRIQPWDYNKYDGDRVRKITYTSRVQEIGPYRYLIPFIGNANQLRELNSLVEGETRPVSWFNSKHFGCLDIDHHSNVNPGVTIMRKEGNRRDVVPFDGGETGYALNQGDLVLVTMIFVGKKKLTVNYCPLRVGDMKSNTLMGSNTKTSKKRKNRITTTQVMALVPMSLYQ